MISGFTTQEQLLNPEKNVQYTTFRKLVILAFITLSIATVSFATTQTLTGVISDDMCKSKHMMPGHSDADCTRACVKSGSKYVLMVGDKMYVLKGDTKQLAQFAGKRVSVNGDIAGNALSVQSIADAK
jgi:hypothetical protein